MAKKKNDWILPVALGLGAVGLYMYFKKAQPALADPGIIAPGALPGSTTLDTTAPASGSTVTSSGSLSHVNDPSVIKWAAASMSPMNYAQFQKTEGTFTNDDWDGLYLLVSGDPTYGFGTSGGATFWNAWRVKYHINDGTYP